MLLGYGTKEGRIVLLCIILCSVFLSIKYFSGIENTFYYAGFVMKAIHPELLTTDPIVGNDLTSTTSPYKLTLYYLLPKLVGEIWLDDRLIAVLYILTVAAAFLAADRIAVTLGASGVWERIAILLLFLRDHKILENDVNFANHADFHHSAVALPIGLFLLLAGIKGKNLWAVLGLTMLLALVSIHVAPFTAGMALIAFWTVGSLRDRRIIGLLFALGVAAAVWGLFFHIEVPDDHRAPIWDMFVNHWYEGMVVPFDPRFNGLPFTVFGNLVFVLVFGAVLLWPHKAAVPITATRAVAAVALLSWLVLGLYGQFAPPALQYPQLLLFSVTRQLQYPQILAYVALMVFIFRWTDAKTDAVRVMTALLVMFVLAVSGPGNLDRWAGLFVLALATSLAIHWYLTARKASNSWVGTRGATDVLMDSYKTVVALTFVITMGVAMAAASWQKLPAWHHLLKSGVHGASESAVWVGVDTYIRRNTPPEAVILPLQYAFGRYLRPGEEYGHRLLFRRNLVSRSARAVPFPMMLSKGLNLEHFHFALAQKDIIRALPDAWMRGDVGAFMTGVGKLRPVPDTIVVPTPESTRLSGPEFPFEVQGEIRGYTVLRRKPPSKATGKQ
ncbi:MAG: hypothetical protein QGI13_00650 [Rhodospirillales bacterium]|nr:hypothetical protein [Rhodospirillales bacterium]